MICISPLPCYRQRSKPALTSSLTRHNLNCSSFPLTSLFLSHASANRKHHIHHAVLIIPIPRPNSPSHPHPPTAGPPSGRCYHAPPGLAVMHTEKWSREPQRWAPRDEVGDHKRGIVLRVGRLMMLSPMPAVLDSNGMSWMHVCLGRSAVAGAVGGL